MHLYLAGPSPLTMTDRPRWTLTWGRTFCLLFAGHNSRKNSWICRYHLNPSRSGPPSEDGRGSPNSCESRSPRKQEEGVSPTPSPVPSFPSLGKPFPPSSPLSVPPHFTSRIPKGDPLEERLHDMLRWGYYFSTLLLFLPTRAAHVLPV